jgi:polysaccharide biosynthesis/export protein
LPEISGVEHDAAPVELHASNGRPSFAHSTLVRTSDSTSLRTLFDILVRRRLMVSFTVGGLLLVCLFYCLIAPREYDARARVALPSTPASSLSLENAAPRPPSSELAAMVQTETVAGILRSDRLAWQVILDRKLYAAPAFAGRFAKRNPGFRPEAPGPEAQAYLLERFQDCLYVGTMPRTLLIEIRFRTRDPRLSAEVVNALIAAFGRQQADERTQATRQAVSKLQDHLRDLKARADEDDRGLAAFQKKHGILIAPETLSNGTSSTSGHLSAVVAVDELGKELAAASSERLLREAEYRAAAQGNPEVVLAFDPRLSTEANDLTNGFRQLHARRSDLEQELAQISIERGPNFPRVLEIRQQLKDVDGQLEAGSARLRGQFRSAWMAAEDHERLVQQALSETTGEGQQASEAATTYEGMRREADSTRELYLRMQDKVEEAGLAAGARGGDIWVVDEARPPAKPATPNLPLYLAITFFAGLWIAGGGALFLESIRPSQARALLVLLAVVMGAGAVRARGQAPTPNTSGLPTGVARIPQTSDNKAAPNPKDAPTAWIGANSSGMPAGAANLSAAPIAAPIAPGDVLDIGEFHTPEFHSVVRVSAAGTVKLPMLDEVRLEGMSELDAGRAISAELLSRGILNHPQVSVLVTAFVGQDVSILGEVARPGVYPYTAHHRLFDMISAASGLGPAAGAVVNIYHRGDPETAHPVPLDPNGAEGGADRNPELAPGDIVQVTRAGLVYVVGDVIRPGGFIVDPTQQFTVLKALSLAWGPSQNAAASKALLIREESGGRTVTTLNLKRMLRGKDPDQPIRAHDILFVPDSAAKNLFNRTIESAIQSAAGVSIYSGLVYSQRF